MKYNVTKFDYTRKLFIFIFQGLLGFRRKQVNGVVKVAFSIKRALMRKQLKHAEKTANASCFMIISVTTNIPLNCVTVYVALKIRKVVLAFTEKRKVPSNIILITSQYHFT